MYLSVHVPRLFNECVCIKLTAASADAVLPSVDG